MDLIKFFKKTSPISFPSNCFFLSLALPTYRLLAMFYRAHCLLWLVLLSFPLHAQTSFPVQVALGISAPYSPFLSDYAGNLQVTLLLNDLPGETLPVRLQWQISGTLATGQTPTAFPLPPITLTGGVPLTLSRADLQAYLLPASVGLTEDRLPDGLYTFALQVVDAQRGLVISNTARQSLRA
jgi:hypothetical protein